MGSFANTVFSVLLGWVRSAVSYLWALLTGSGGGLIGWIGENWLTVVILLCAAGMVIDALVYLLRWRPYRVWASFFRRLRGKGQEADEPAPLPKRPAPRRREAHREAEVVPLTPVEEVPQEPRRAWVYPDGSARPEELPPADAPLMPETPLYQPLPAVEELPPMNPRTASAELSEQYVMRYARPEAPQAAPAATEPMQFAAAGRAYRRAGRTGHLQYEQEHQPQQLTAVPGLEDYPQPRGEQTTVQPDFVERTRAPEDRPEPIRRERLMKRMAALPRDFGLGGDEDELQLHYQPAPPAVDKREAYHEPVYPPQWRPPADMPSTKEESGR